MVELIKYLLERPTQGILAILCGGGMFLALGLFDVREAIAGLQKQQDVFIETHVKVSKINDSVIRMEVLLEELAEDSDELRITSEELQKLWRNKENEN